MAGDVLEKEIRGMKLKRMGRLGLGIMMLIFVMGTAAVAQDDEPVFTADLTLDYNSMYVWRGQVLNGESVFQPAISGSAYGFTASIWSNIDFTDAHLMTDEDGEYGGASSFSEVDYTLDYSGSVPGMEKLGYSVGVIHYIFPMPPLEPTTEIYFGASLDTVLSPFVTIYQDVNNVKGTYIQFGVGQSFEKDLGSGKSVGLDLSASFGLAESNYNNFYFGVNETKWNDFTLGVAVPFNLKGGVSITPSLHVSTLLDDTIATNHEAIYSVDAYTADRSNVWFGVSLSKSF
jgi:hypothetical protein